MFYSTRTHIRRDNDALPLTTSTHALLVHRLGVLTLWVMSESTNGVRRRHREQVGC